MPKEAFDESASLQCQCAKILDHPGTAADQWKLLLSGSILHGEACRYAGTDSPLARVGEVKDTALRGLRQRYQPPFSERFADSLTLHLLSLRPGHEICGEIVETGSGVEHCRTGDLVCVVPSLNCSTRPIKPACWSCAAGIPANCENFAEGAFSPGMFIGICKDINGGFAEYSVAHKSQVYHVPSGVSPESAALVEPLAVGLQAVLDNRPEDGDKVLVIGGGVIGAMVVKCIRALGSGCDITVAEPSLFAADYVKQCGANRTITGGMINAAVEITGGRAYRPMLGERLLMGGFDKVYDTVGHADTLNMALRVTGTNGTLSIIGIGKEVKLDLTTLWLKLQTVKGCYGYRYNHIEGGRKHAYEMALDLISSKKARVDDMLTHKFPLEKYRELIEVNVNKGSHRAMKTAFSFDRSVPRKPSPSGQGQGAQYERTTLPESPAL